VKAVLQRAAVAAAVLWLAAAVLYASSGRWSIVLLLAPLVFAAGDAWAVRRKARLTAWLDAELQLLVSEDDDQVFRAADAVIVEKRERLLGGLPPVLLAKRTLRMPDGQLIQVQAKVRRLGRADEIAWRVERLRPR
jgi:hypothetical protein